MPGKYAKKKHASLTTVFLAMVPMLASIAVLLFLVVPSIQPSPTDPTTGPAVIGTQPQQATVSTETTVPPTTEPEKVPIIEATASFTVTGDLLMHKPVFQSCWDGNQNDWIFDPVFTYVTPYIQAADYAVANLETTLRGETDGYVYSGYPMFNCPDGIATASKNAGFDMLLTGNNHCYDTRMQGVRRTLEVVTDNGLATLGTQYDADAPKYKVVEINGIKIGLTAYTYETSDNSPDVPSINGIPCSTESVGMINSFDYNQLNKFYAEIGSQFEGMKEEGAEAIVVFIHWGVEYQLEPNDSQKKIAQVLCDMGVDVIVGGHPHVIQPVDLLTSSQDENHKTLIIYSTGNALSNQRVAAMQLKSGHTEDGILFHFTFVKYGDGTVSIMDTSCTPTWVYLQESPRRYYILPLDYSLLDQWQDTFSIRDVTYNACLASYNRTMDLVGAGIETAQSWFQEAHQAKVDQLSNPT